MGTYPCFSVIFTKVNKFCDFLFAFLDNKALLKRVYPVKEIIWPWKSLVHSCKKEFAPRGASSFLQKCTPHWERQN